MVISEVKKVFFIVNKYSGTGYQPEVEGRIIDTCRAHDVECTIMFTAHAGHATELAREAIVAGFSKVIAVGGDGTVNEVAKALLHSPVTMGILPKGSGNGLARHLGIPMKMQDALNALFNSKEIAMDAFTVNDRLSMNVSGLGFDGHIANLFGNTKKRGLAGYAKLTIREFFRFKEFSATITINGKTQSRKAFIMAIANSSQYGNNARIAPAASVCDQLLHISILKKVPPYRLDFVYDFFSGKIDASAYCDVIAARDLTIETDTPIAYHIDGEPCGTASAFSIALLPAALRMTIPVTQMKY